MDGLTVLCFLILLYFISKVDKLEKQIKKQTKKRNVEKEEKEMSKLIKDLIGKKCGIKLEDDFSTLGVGIIVCDVLDADEEWIKISYEKKKEGKVIAIARISSINSIQELSTEQAAM